MSFDRYIKVQEKTATISLECEALDIISELDNAKNLFKVISEDPETITNLQIGEIWVCMNKIESLITHFLKMRERRITLRELEEQLAK